MAKRTKSGAASPPSDPPPPPAPPPPVPPNVTIGPLMGEEPEAPKHLEDLLVALQKSFSRVSAASTRANVGEDNARALITGAVSFELTAKFDLAYKPGMDPRVGLGVQSLSGMRFPYATVTVGSPSPDQLRLNADGAIQLHLRGTLSTDVRMVEAGTSGASEPDAGKPPAEPTPSEAKPGSGDFVLSPRE